MTFFEFLILYKDKTKCTMYLWFTLNCKYDFHLLIRKVIRATYYWNNHMKFIKTLKKKEACISIATPFFAFSGGNAMSQNFFLICSISIFFSWVSFAAMVGRFFKKQRNFVTSNVLRKDDSFIILVLPNGNDVVNIIIGSGKWTFGYEKLVWGKTSYFILFRQAVE